jgi:hypothetical protein
VQASRWQEFSERAIDFLEMVASGTFNSLSGLTLFPLLTSVSKNPLRSGPGQSLESDAIDQLGDLIQQSLGLHIRGTEHRLGKREFSDKGRTFVLQDITEKDEI